MNLKRPTVAVLFLLLFLATGWLLADVVALNPVLGLLRLDGRMVIEEHEPDQLVSALAVA